VANGAISQRLATFVSRSVQWRPRARLVFSLARYHIAYCTPRLFVLLSSICLQTKYHSQLIHRLKTTLSGRCLTENGSETYYDVIYTKQCLNIWQCKYFSQYQCKTVSANTYSCVIAFSVRTCILSSAESVLHVTEAASCNYVSVTGPRPRSRREGYYDLQ
jgi:hypothetical protein